MESLFHFVFLHPLQSFSVDHQIIPYLFYLVSPIRLSRQPNMCFSKPVPLTCNILAGADPNNPYASSPKETLSNALKTLFLQKFVKPSTVKPACFNSSHVMSEHDGIGLESSSNRHLQSQ